MLTLISALIMPQKGNIPSPGFLHAFCSQFHFLTENNALKPSLLRNYVSRDIFFIEANHTSLMGKETVFIFICSPRFYWHGKLTKFPFIVFLLSLAGKRKCNVCCKTSYRKITGFLYQRLLLNYFFHIVLIISQFSR